MSRNPVSNSGAPATADASRAMNSMRNIVRALRINTREMEVRMGISLAQLFVLQQLSESPVDSLNELAERTATHQSSVSVVVRRLAERGLVRRSGAPQDHRRIQIALTEEGREKLASAPPTVQARLVDGLSRMDVHHRQQLADLMEEWLDESGINFANPPMIGEEEHELAAMSA